jgi:hypothetical protein
MLISNLKFLNRRQAGEDQRFELHSAKHYVCAKTVQPELVTYATQ